MPVNWQQFIGIQENKANISDFLSNELMTMADQYPGFEIGTSGGFDDIKEANTIVWS